MTTLTTRFAPSPTGDLHLGHAYSAWRAHDFARANDGTFLLRIEDIDQGRCRPEFEQHILEDLIWLGIRWDAPPIRQSEHFPVYHSRITELRARGLVYRCFKTRREINEILSAPHGRTDGAYRGEPLPEAEEDRLLLEGAPFAWRLSAEQVAAEVRHSDIGWDEQTADGVIRRPADWLAFGDVVLARKDCPTSYHVASIHDDILAGVTHIVRGEDLRPSADLHALLYFLFGAAPPVYQHHPLITNDRGDRLAKRDHAQTIRSLRENGKSPSDLRRMVGLGL